MKGIIIALIYAIGIAGPSEPGMKAKNVIEVMLSSADHRQLALTLQTPDVINPMLESGTFTVFAPNDKAFSRLPKDIIANMRNPDYSSTTESILDYHVVQGKYTEQDIVRSVKASKDGRFTLISLQGSKLTFSILGDYVKITDEIGHEANIRFSHVEVGNGIVHTIDMMMMPKD